MSDFTDLSHLPKAERSTEGEPPDKESRFGRLLIDERHDAGIERDKHFRDGDSARFWHSSAGDCSRALAYQALGVPQSNPMDAPGHFITWQGQAIHDAFQAVLQERFPGAEIETRTGEGAQRGGHADVVIRHEGKIIVIELKSMGGYAYKLAVGDKGPATGPKYEHKLQVALNAHDLDADEAVIIYLARDAISVQQAQRKNLPDIQRVTAEWTYTREQYQPLARKEIERVTAILGLLDEGILPSRKIPDPELPLRHVIVNPAKGEWMSTDEKGQLENAGVHWRCAYCRYRDTCARTGSHREPVDVLVKLGVLNEEALHGGQGETREQGQPGGS